MQKKVEFLGLLSLAFSRGALRMIVFSKPIGNLPKKISGKPKKNGNRVLLVLESTLPGNTVSQRNVTPSAFSEVLFPLFDGYLQINLLTTQGDCEYRVGKNGKEAYLGLSALVLKLQKAEDLSAVAFDSIDRKKNYLLSGNEKFLYPLGISDKDGRVHDKMQGKFRQINRFLEHIEDCYDKLPKDKPLLVYDLCCGKSYLSFAVYYYLTEMKKRKVHLLGIDLKEDVIRYCQKVASDTGFSGMEFVAGDIGKTPADNKPDMVISLHACDVATDIVLENAIRLCAPVILSTPCCHRYLKDKLKASELSFITKHPHLSGKLAEAATDALRALRLKAEGYTVSVVELTDPTDTPKNTLLRAFKTKDFDKGAQIEYENALRFLLGDGAKEYLKGII